MMFRLILPLILLAQPLAAGSFSDAVFDPVAMQAALGDEPLRYDHILRMPELPKTDMRPLTPAEEEKDEFTLTKPEDSRLALERVTQGETQPISDFNVNSANPILIYFLESTARNMTEITGGSPFYIRNRLREALGKPDLGPIAEIAIGDSTATAREVIMRPFAEDAIRSRMGAFAELTLRFVVDADQPGRILVLAADAVGVEASYHESLILKSEGK